MRSVKQRLKIDRPRADLETIGKEPLYYTDIAERFAAHDFRTVARALGHLHAMESCGRTRAAAYACATPSSRPSRRGGEARSGL
jgi:hypothetical protein